MENNEITIAKSIVLTMYEIGNNDVKTVLKYMFPEILNAHKHFNLFALAHDQTYIFDDEKSKKAGFFGRTFMSVRQSGEYTGKAFFLSNNYNWELKIDSKGMICLIPTAIKE